MHYTKAPTVTVGNRNSHTSGIRLSLIGLPLIQDASLYHMSELFIVFFYRAFPNYIQRNSKECHQKQITPAKHPNSKVISFRGCFQRRIIGMRIWMILRYLDHRWIWIWIENYDFLMLFDDSEGSGSSKNWILIEYVDFTMVFC